LEVEAEVVTEAAVQAVTFRDQPVFQLAQPIILVLVVAQDQEVKVVVRQDLVAA
jgi:hypothetical protein